MNHIVIKQDTSGTEEVNASIINALYEAVIDEYLDNTSELLGRLHTIKGSYAKIEYLTNKYSNKLFISADAYVLDFEDSEVENICVTNWGSEGTVTVNQLNAVSNASTLFKNNTTILSFNEFKYFTSVGDNYSFSGCTALQEITLPPSKTTLREGAFDGCKSLQQFDLSNITSIGKNAFRHCENCLFSNMSHVTTFLENALSYCYKITNLEICSGMSLGMSCFSNCKYLTTVTFNGDFISSSYGSIFDECWLLTSVTFNGPVSYIPFRCFRKCTALSTIDLSNVYSYRVSNNDPYYGGHFAQCGSLSNVTLSPHVNRLEGGMFSYCGGLATITIPANVTEIGNSCFYGCRSLIVTMLPTTPPTLTLDGSSNYEHFSMIAGIKVPAGTLSAYQNATGWSTFASIMSESIS